MTSFAQVIYSFLYLPTENDRSTNSTGMLSFQRWWVTQRNQQGSNFRMRCSMNLSLQIHNYQWHHTNTESLLLPLLSLTSCFEMWKWNIFHSTCAITCVVPQCSFCCTALLWHGRVSKPPALGRWAPITHWGWHRVCETALQIPGQHVQPSGISPLSFRPAALHKPHDAFEWQIQHWTDSSRMK